MRGASWLWTHSFPASFLGRPPFFPFARDAAVFRADFTAPPTAPRIDAARASCAACCLLRFLVCRLFMLFLWLVSLDRFGDLLAFDVDRLANRFGYCKRFFLAKINKRLARIDGRNCSPHAQTPGAARCRIGLGGWTQDTTAARYDHAKRLDDLRAAVTSAGLG